MYLFYEAYPASTHVDAIYECILSQDGNSSKAFGGSSSDRSTAEFLISLFKQVPTADRVYDEKTHIWTLVGLSGPRLIAGVESFIVQKMLLNLRVKKIKNLAYKASIQQLSKVWDSEAEDSTVPDPEEFFYKNTEAAPLKQGIPLRNLQEQLSEIFKIPSKDFEALEKKELQKLYRASALRLHPDRNNGDSSQMSNLNMLWQEFKKIGGV